MISIKTRDKKKSFCVIFIVKDNIIQHVFFSIRLRGRNVKNKCK